MSTHNICIRRKIRKILCGYPLLSVAMLHAEELTKRDGIQIPFKICGITKHCKAYLCTIYIATTYIKMHEHSSRQEEKSMKYFFLFLPKNIFVGTH